MKEFKIANKKIGKQNPCFIIAEAGVNHNGQLDLAYKLVDIAKEAGVDAVKFQTYKTKDLVTQTASMADYQVKNIGKKQSQSKMLQDLELGYQDFAKIKKYCDKKKIIFLSTPHTFDSFEFLKKIVPAFKIGSGDLTNIPFLQKVAKAKKPVILSTGMATLAEAKEAYSAVKKYNKNIIVLHCSTEYPCPLEDVNLRVLKTFQDNFDCPIGYSDHTQGISVPVMACNMGAQVIEKHFTINKNMKGPDHKASLSPSELKEMVLAIRRGDKIKIPEIVLGSSIKKPTKKELQSAKVARKSLVAQMDIAKGAVIKEKMIAIKRPGTGLEPKFFYKIIGKTAKKEIKKDSLIKIKDLC